MWFKTWHYALGPPFLPSPCPHASASFWKACLSICSLFVGSFPEVRVLASLGGLEKDVSVWWRRRAHPSVCGGPGVRLVLALSGACLWGPTGTDRRTVLSLCDLLPFGESGRWVEQPVRQTQDVGGLSLWWEGTQRLSIFLDRARKRQQQDTCPVKCTRIRCMHCELCHGSVYLMEV